MEQCYGVKSYCILVFMGELCLYINVWDLIKRFGLTNENPS